MRYSEPLDAQRAAHVRAAFQGSAAQVRCVRLWHHNLPSLRVRVEMRNAAGEWEALGSYDAAGAQWVQLSLSSANEL